MKEQQQRNVLDQSAEGRLSGCGPAEDGMWTVRMLVTVLSYVRLVAHEYHSLPIRYAVTSHCNLLYFYAAVLCMPDSIDQLSKYYPQILQT